MKKSFNTTGPCQPSDHYMLPAQERCEGVMDLIENKHYFVIHAARQTGKTTLLLDLVKQMNASGEYYALYCSLETIQGIDEAEKGIPAIIERIQFGIEFSETLGNFPFAEDADYSKFSSLLSKSLARFCKTLDKPLVILFDEVDCLSSQTMISFLRQIRDGYISRGQIPFVYSAALVGMRNIRDFKAKIREDSKTLGSASPFNIAAESLTIRNFKLEEVKELYSQHTKKTGQEFPLEVVNEVFESTQGQPWLVNAIAREIVEKILKRDFSKSIKQEQVNQAIQSLILKRVTHIDSLLERLKEERVQKIVEPMILGKEREFESLDDDFQYVMDLGLLSLKNKKLFPANPIYTEVILRVLSHQAQMGMDDREFPPEAPAYLVDGKLNMNRLLTDFQEFWRENSEIWGNRFQYREAAPHLILQAFLQRVINSGGSISREMAFGNLRLDLCLHFQGYRYPIELKIRYGEKSYEQGKQQLLRYLDRLDCKEGWLIVFDRREEILWEQKIFWKTETRNGKIIHVVGG